MKRRNFISTTAIGFSLLNFPDFASAENKNNGEMLQPFYIPPQNPLPPGPGNSDFVQLYMLTRPINNFLTLKFLLDLSKWDHHHICIKS